MAPVSCEEVRGHGGAVPSPIAPVCRSVTVGAAWEGVWVGGVTGVHRLWVWDRVGVQVQGPAFLKRKPEKTV